MIKLVNKIFNASSIGNLCFSPDERHLIYATNNNALCFHDICNDVATKQIDMPTFDCDVACSRDGLIATRFYLNENAICLYGNNRINKRTLWIPNKRSSCMA